VAHIVWVAGKRNGWRLLSLGGSGTIPGHVEAGAKLAISQFRVICSFLNIQPSRHPCQTAEISPVNSPRHPEKTLDLVSGTTQDATASRDSHFDYGGCGVSLIQPTARDGRHEQDHIGVAFREPMWG